MDGISQEKKEWMEQVGMEEFERPMKFYLPFKRAVFSEEYIKSTPLEQLKERCVLYGGPYTFELDGTVACAHHHYIPDWALLAKSSFQPSKTDDTVYRYTNPEMEALGEAYWRNIPSHSHELVEDNGWFIGNVWPFGKPAKHSESRESEA